MLLAEDNEEDVDLWSRALKNAGLPEEKLFIVRDGVEAVDYLAGTGIYEDRSAYPFPQMLLLDLSMPNLGGFEVLEWWRSARRSEKLTVVVLSGSTMREDIDRAHKLGAAAYLSKPAHLVQVRLLAQRALDFMQRSPRGGSLLPAA